MRRSVKKVSALLAVALLLTLLAPMAGAADVRLSSQALKVNGQAVPCGAYNIDGSNYLEPPVSPLLDFTPVMP